MELTEEDKKVMLEHGIQALPRTVFSAGGWTFDDLGDAVEFCMSRAERTQTRLAEEVDQKLMSKAERQQAIDEHNACLREASADGRTGETKRQIARGNALWNNEVWNDLADFQSSLVVRPDRVFFDPDLGQPLTIRVSQSYPSTLLLGRYLTAHVELRIPGKRTPEGRQPSQLVRRYPQINHVPPDLIDVPLVTRIDIDGVEDGNYAVRVELRDGETLLGIASARIKVRTYLDARIKRLSEAARQAGDGLEHEIMFPVHFMEKADMGHLPVRGFNLSEEIAAAERLALLAAGGSNPFDQIRGEFSRHQVLPETGEIFPYRLFVPDDYAQEQRYPLVVVLHALGINERAMFSDVYGVVDAAKERGYMVMGPSTYRDDAGWTSLAPGDRCGALSEQLLLQSLALTRKNYSIDPDRIYLLGFSMGGVGVWSIAARNPAIWAALAPISGGGDPSTAETILHLPQMVVHGDSDTAMPVEGSRVMVEALTGLGANVSYVEVAGGGHVDVAQPNMDAIFNFFDKHTRAAGNPSG